MQVQAIGVEQDVGLEAVKNLVAKSVIQITVKMMTALIASLGEKIDVKTLAERHIVKTLNEDVSESDKVVQKVYSKLFAATNEHILMHSLPLSMTLSGINLQTRNVKSGDMFLGSFVLPEAKSLIETLKVEQPWALEELEIWG